MKKLSLLILVLAIAGTVSLTAYAHTPAGFGMGDFGGFGHFGGFGYNYGGFGYSYAGFGMDYGAGFGGFGSGMTPGMGNYGFSFGMMPGSPMDAFSSVDFSRIARQAASRKIVPIPPTASVSTSSIILDESGEIRIRPFDDEDLFVED